MSYSITEKVSIIKWYYTGNSLRAVSEMFSVYFPDKPILLVSLIKYTIDKFESKGTIINNCKCSTQNVNRAEEGDNKDLNILLQVKENKMVSTRILGPVVERHQTIVLHTLKKHKYFSYKFQKHQELREGDEERRMAFCFEVMERANNNRDFIRNICFTDESTFTLNNEPNIQNWRRENEHRLVHTRTQYPQKVNVWAGIFGHHIIGPFFLEDNLTGETYLNLLQNQIVPAVEEVAVKNQEIWYQMDGCPAHNSLMVRHYLQNMNIFNGNIIGPRYLIPWPARSPDLSPNDFFLWGHLKSVIYKNVRFENLDQLKNSISLECDRIFQYQPSNVRNAFYDRLGHCLAANGGLFEHLIK